MKKTIQAKHIDQSRLLSLVGRSEYTWVSGWIIADKLRLPWKVVNARLAALKRRGIVDGCSCGCRGDWHLTELGRSQYPDAGVTESQRDAMYLNARPASTPEDETP